MNLWRMAREDRHHPPHVPDGSTRLFTARRPVVVYFIGPYLFVTFLDACFAAATDETLLLWWSPGLFAVLAFPLFLCVIGRNRRPASEHTCPWCHSLLAPRSLQSCPSCNAELSPEPGDIHPDVSSAADFYPCTQCGYDLSGAKGTICPECGADNADRPLESTPAPRPGELVIPGVGSASARPRPSTLARVGAGLVIWAVLSAAVLGSNASIIAPMAWHTHIPLVVSALALAAAISVYSVTFLGRIGSNARTERSSTSGHLK